MEENLYIYLLEKEATNELSASEKADLKNWLAASAENRETARVIRQILRSSEQYASSPEIDLDARFAELESKLSADKTAVRSIAPRFNWWRVAATFALLISGFYVFQYFSQPTEIQWVDLGIAESEQEVIVFSDGSKMTLNGDSDVTYPEIFLKGERRVKLSGEAFFEVQKNPSKPFIVELENGEVRVLGTSFNVNARPADETVSVFVKTGKVEFAPEENAKVILTKNESGVFHKKEKTLKETSMSNSNEISWLTRKLEFRSTPLSEVLESVAKLYRVSINFDNPEMANCPLDLSFEDEKLTDVLQTVAGVFEMSISEPENDVFLLSGGSCY